MESKSYPWRPESSFKAMYRNVMLHHLNIRPLCFMWRLTYGGEFLAVVQSLKSVVCLRKFNSTVCEHLGQDDYATFEYSVYSTFTDWQSITLLISMIPSLLIIPLIAYYLQHGRKKIAIVVMAILEFLSSVVYMLNAYFPEMYVSGYVIAAVLHASYGFAYGFRLITYSYLADITASYSPERRSAEMMLQSAFRVLGAVCSPYLMGYLLANFGAQYAFMVSCAWDGLMVIYSCMLVEVQPVDESGKTSGANQGHRRGLHEFIAPLMKAKLQIMNVVIVYAILEALTVITFNFLPVYVTHSPYSFTSIDLGLYQTVQFTMAFIGTLGISQLFTRVVGNQDIGIAMACLLARIFMCSVLMAATSKVLLYLAVLTEMINYTYVGALYSHAIEITGKEGFVPLFLLMTEVGLLVCTVVYPLVNYLFKTTASTNPQLTFILLMSLAVIGFAVWVFHICLRHREQKSPVLDRKTSTSPLIDDLDNATSYTFTNEGYKDTNGLVTTNC